MSDFEWPEAIPFRVQFYLQPYTSRSQSPWTRATKIYGLSQPIWVARLTVRTGYNGEDGVSAWGGVMDAFLADMEGGANRVALWDFRRPFPVGLRRYYRQFAGIRYPFLNGEEFSMGERFIIPSEAEPTNEAAEAGATQMTFVGLKPGERVFQTGDYVGGDGRPHIILAPGATVGDDGKATIAFKPPLVADVEAGAAKTMQPPGWFRLVSDDAGANETDVGEMTTYTLDFTEDPWW